MAKEIKPYSPFQESFGNAVVKFMSVIQTWIYKKSGGKRGNKFLQGADVALLTVVGRKSGKERTTPLLFLEDGDNIVIVASKGGFSQSPQWYFNLKANPDAKIQIGSQVREMKAHEASPDEVAKAWPRLVKIYSDFDEYKVRAEMCEREIPLMVLTPV
ncbi:MAG: nitroreductase family deazaflavin-dependent oxidoreductase [Deltaproteobacteria bacterium]|nr:nitroreductase family deazaflavin-dependent oxidoreductase [Deltaproteobacteria bacterium]